MNSINTIKAFQFVVSAMKRPFSTVHAGIQIDRSFVDSIRIGLPNLTLVMLLGTLLLVNLTDVGAAPQYPGDSFTQISPVAESREYVSVIQAGSRLVRISYRGDVEISENQGVSWLNRSPGFLVPLSDIAWTGSRLVAVGNSGRIIGSDNLGLSWQNLPSNASSDYYSIAWTGTHLLASGINGLTSQSGDGGNTWRTYYFNGLGQFYGAGGISNAWALVGTGGRIIGSNDLGESWYTLREGVAGAPALNDIIFTGTEFIVAGDSGAILRGTKLDAMTPVASGSTSKLVNLSRIGTRIFACGGQDHGGSAELQTILSSDNGGLTWSPRFSGIVGRAYGVVGVAPNLLAIGSPELTADSMNDGNTWQARIKALSAPATDDFSKMIHADGVIVGVGYGGNINTSSDGGRTWSVRNSQTTKYLYDVLKTGNRWVVVGESGIVRTSDDNGVTWTSRSFGASGHFIGLADTGSTLVIVGANGSATAAIAYYSIDQGSTWTQASVPAASFLYSVKWTGTSLVAVGYNGEAMRSSDQGRTWTRLVTGTSVFFTELAAGPGYLLGGTSDGTIFRSSNDGTTWIPVAGTMPGLGSNQDFHFDGSTWFAIGYSGIIVSNDGGLTWIENPHYVTQNSCRVVHDGNSLILVNTTLHEVYSSRDGGESWTGVNVGTIRQITGITKKDGRHVAVGGVGQIMTSDNEGATWEIWSTRLVFSDLNDVESTPSGFVVVGESGQLLTSTNGKQWTPRGIPVGTLDLRGVAYGGGRIVVVGEGGNALVSTNDGVDWTAHPAGTGGILSGITYGNGQFVATGDSGVILTSPDGITWTSRASGTTKSLWGATWTGIRYVAIGGTSRDSSGGGIILTSEDGVAWTIRASELVDAPQAIEVIGSRVVALGNTMRGISSNGGINWTIDSGTLNWFRAVHWDGGILLAGGLNKNLWISQGNAEGLAALGLVPAIEVLGPESLPLNNGTGTITRPSVVVGEQGDSISLTIRNTGNSPLTGLTVIPAGVASAEFHVDVTSMKLSLDPGEMTAFGVRFSPSVAGMRAATLQISSNDPDDSPYTISLTGTGTTPRQMFDSAMSASGLTGDDSLAGAVPHGDGVSNLLKYAFNMNLEGSDGHLLAPSGFSGLPLIRVVEIEGLKYWQVEYVRRKSSGLVYVPECSSSLDGDSFLPMSGIPQITGIDASWERVSLSKPYDPGFEPRQFSRIMVRIP